jgi:hypothetical protein
VAFVITPSIALFILCESTASEALSCDICPAAIKSISIPVATAADAAGDTVNLQKGEVK